MAAYVDPLMRTLCSVSWPYPMSCHLFADSIQELHAAARRIGLVRAHFQSRARLPHYDLTAGMRLRALRCGIVSLNRRDAAAKMRSLMRATHE